MIILFPNEGTDVCKGVWISLLLLLLFSYFALQNNVGMGTSSDTNLYFMIRAQILARSLANFYRR